MGECAYCGRQVRWFLTPSGKHLPFDLGLVHIAAAADIGWVPLNGPAGTYLRPTRDLSDHKLAGVEWVAIRHLCAEYEVAKMRINLLGWADEWTKSLLMTLQRRRKRPTRRVDDGN